MRSTLLVVALALPAVAQGYVPDPVRPVAPAAVLRNSHSLVARTDGPGLRGGGADYRVRFDADGVRYEPALGGLVAETQHLALRPRTVRSGAGTVLQPTACAPLRVGNAAHYRHGPGVTERYEVRPDGVALSWVFAERPATAGDLVVRYDVDTSLPVPAPHGDGLAFRLADSGGVSIGGVTGIDANGRTAAGSVRWVDGGIELALPASFVASAVFPLVLDPLLGTVFSVSVGLANDDDEPDVAWEHGSFYWLVAWRRRFSATDSDIRGQRIDAFGSLSGGTIFLGSSGVVTRPRIAPAAWGGLFGVTWIQQVTGTVSVSQVAFQTVDTSSGTVGNFLVLASSPSQVYEDVDIGSQTVQVAPLGVAFFVVYRAPGQGAIRARRVTMLSATSTLQSPEFPVLTDVVLGTLYSQPAISRTTSNGELLVVARRAAPLTSFRGLTAAVVHTYDNTVGATLNFASSSIDDVAVPDVDGMGGRWVVAWERPGVGGTYDAVRVAPVALDAAGTTLTAGAFVTFGGTLTNLAQAPSVGWSEARTWLGYQRKTFLPTVVTTLRVVAIDSASCADCTDGFAVQVYNDEKRIVVAPQAVGDADDTEEALAVWGAGPALDVYAQRLRNYASTTPPVNLGGKCGVNTVRATTQLHDLVIGTRWNQGVFTTGIAAIFNLAVPQPTIPCGTCAWTPFESTVVVPVAGFGAGVELSIPCVPGLVGAQLESQWTVIGSVASPCAVFPGVSLSDRMLHTVGQ